MRKNTGVCRFHFCYILRLWIHYPWMKTLVVYKRYFWISFHFSSLQFLLYVGMISSKNLARFGATNIVLTGSICIGDEASELLSRCSKSETFVSPRHRLPHVVGILWTNNMGYCYKISNRLDVCSHACSQFVAVIPVIWHHRLLKSIYYYFTCQQQYAKISYAAAFWQKPSYEQYIEVGCYLNINIHLSLAIP